MKANEIVIGSQFVVGKGTNNPTYVKVDEVLGPCVSLHGWEFCTYLDLLEPIPITQALLLKNGFRRTELPCDTEWAEYEKEVDGYWLSFRLGVLDSRVWYLHVDNSDRDTVAGCDIQYVHQAQALMAIFGVELEFNFC